MRRNNLKAYLFILVGIIWITSDALAEEVKKLDASKSKMEWLGKKVTGQHSGTIKLADGELVMEGDNISKANFTVDMTSIANTDLKDEGYRAKLEGHLKSDDFFGVEKYPKATFEMDESKSLGNGTFDVKGKITIKGITNPVEFKVMLSQQGEGTHVEGKIVIDRTKFNVRYGSGSFFDNLGDKTIYDDFELSLDLYLQ